MDGVRALLAAALLVPVGVHLSNEVPQRRADLVALDATLDGLLRNEAGEYLPPRLRGEVAGWVEFVEATVPREASYRLMQGPLSTASRRLVVTPVEDVRACGLEVTDPFVATEYRWVTYQWLPRRSTCSRDGRWFVFQGVRPTGLPDDATTQVFAPDLVVVEAPSGWPELTP